MTGNERHAASAVMMSSVSPSLKYSCSGSPDMLAKGSTAIDGLSWIALTRFVGAGRRAAATPAIR